MTTQTSVGTSYELSNYRTLLAGVIAKAEAAFNKEKGGAKALKAKIEQHVRGGTFVQGFQIQKPESGRLMTIREIANSAKHETTRQAVVPASVDAILFGPDGLISKTGGTGRAPYLQEDIEVGYIDDNFSGNTIGPIITSGRNRVLAIQALLFASGMPEESILNLQVRVSVVKVKNDEELIRRIISANMGSRDMGRAEARERMGAVGGINLSDRTTIEETLRQNDVTEKVLQAALGAWVKDAAEGQDLNTYSPNQYSDAGSSLWNHLTKAPYKVPGQTLNRWVREDMDRFFQIARIAESNLGTAVESIKDQRTAGGVAPKLARFLAPLVAKGCGLPS